MCEHSLAESALISLEALFDEEPGLAERMGAQRGEYLRLAKFFIDNKGNHENRHQFPPFLREYAQDHRTGREQREAVGHAVRATLFYTGMAEAAAASETSRLTLTGASRETLSPSFLTSTSTKVTERISSLSVFRAAAA